MERGEIQMILLFFILLMLIVCCGLIKYAYYLEEKANQQSCYSSLFVKGAVRGIVEMFASESMLQYRRNNVNRKNSKF